MTWEHVIMDRILLTGKKKEGGSEMNHELKDMLQMVVQEALAPLNDRFDKFESRLINWSLVLTSWSLVLIIWNLALTIWKAR